MVLADFHFTMLQFMAKTNEVGRRRDKYRINCRNSEIFSRTRRNTYASGLFVDNLELPKRHQLARVRIPAFEVFPFGNDHGPDAIWKYAIMRLS